MYNPKFQILLRSENFSQDDKFACLGSQLTTTINFLKGILSPHFWYAANVTSLDHFDKENEISSFKLILIGDDSALISTCHQIGQFLSGVFFAVKSDYAIQNINNIYVDTEDEQYRSLDIEGVFIELRAFDTSYFEVYSDNKTIIEKLAEKFNVNEISDKIES